MIKFELPDVEVIYDDVEVSTEGVETIEFTVE